MAGHTPANLQMRKVLSVLLTGRKWIDARQTTLININNQITQSRLVTSVGNLD